MEVEGVGREMADCPEFAEFPVRDSTHLGQSLDPVPGM